MIEIDTQMASLIKSAVDERYGEGTFDLTREAITKQYTHEQIAIRIGVSRVAITRRVNRAKAYTRRLLRGAGMIEDDQCST